MTPPRIAIFVSFSGQGGVENMITRLAQGMLALGCEVDLVLAKARGEHLDAIPSGVHVIQLNAKSTMTALPGLVRYLRQRRPTALLAAKDRAIKTAVIARRMSGLPIPLAGRLGTTVSAALAGRGAWRRWLWYNGMRLFYRHVDHIVAVSRGVADDIVAITGLDAARISVVRNPVVTPNLSELAQHLPDHPWLGDAGVPIILGAGRLTRQKDFPTLINAFARLRRNTPCRLIILGEGGDRPALQSLIHNLGLDGDIALPGFSKHIYGYLARASLFVLSSRWEGSPNVLTEALALGTPVVATDCPSGPREILDHGRYGPLVPIGDTDALANAMRQTLITPPDPATLRTAVAEYTVEKSARRYLEAMGIHL